MHFFGVFCVGCIPAGSRPRAASHPSASVSTAWNAQPPAAFPGRPTEQSCLWGSGRLPLTNDPTVWTSRLRRPTVLLTVHSAVAPAHRCRHPRLHVAVHDSGFPEVSNGMDMVKLAGLIGITCSGMGIRKSPPGALQPSGGLTPLELTSSLSSRFFS